MKFKKRYLVHWLTWPIWLAALLVLYSVGWVYAFEPLANLIRTNLIMTFISSGGFLAIMLVAAVSIQMNRRQKGYARFIKVASLINNFEPSRNYKLELAFQAELMGWVKCSFPQAKMENQTGASRPDIVIDDIAIEIKAHPDRASLDTLLTKCLKYFNYYKYVIIVIFDFRLSETDFSTAHLEEIRRG